MKQTAFLASSPTHFSLLFTFLVEQCCQSILIDFADGASPGICHYKIFEKFLFLLNNLIAPRFRCLLFGDIFLLSANKINGMLK